MDEVFILRTDIYRKFHLVKPTNLDLFKFLNYKLRFPTPESVSIQEYIIPNITKDKRVMIKSSALGVEKIVGYLVNL